MTVQTTVEAVEQQSSFRQQAPKLSSRGLTMILGLMCLIPIVTISFMWLLLPPVKLNRLDAEIELSGAPPASYYKLPMSERNYLPEEQIVIRNVSDQRWSNIYIRVNHNYSFFESGVELGPGETREYFLNRFSSRTGAFFDMRYNAVHEVMIYARLPDRSRATYFRSFAPPAPPSSAGY